MYAEMNNLNSQMLKALHQLVCDMIDDPSKDMEKGVTFATQALAAWEVLVKMAAQNPSYALQNLPETDQDMARSVRHKLLLLQNTYGPQSGS